MEKVKTISGTTLDRSKTVFIKGKYYAKDGDCFFVDGVYVKNDSDRIAYDHSDKQFHLTNELYTQDKRYGYRMNIPCVAMGIVDYEKKDNTYVLGLFSISPDKCGTVYRQS